MVCRSNLILVNLNEKLFILCKSVYTDFCGPSPAICHKINKILTNYLIKILKLDFETTLPTINVNRLKIIIMYSMITYLETFSESFE